MVLCFPIFSRSNIHGGSKTRPLSMKGYPPRAPRLSPTFFYLYYVSMPNYTSVLVSSAWLLLTNHGEKKLCNQCASTCKCSPHIPPTRHRPLMTGRSSSDHSFLRGGGKLCPSELRRWPTGTSTVRHDQPRRPENIGCRGNSVSICEHSIGTIKKQKKLLGSDSPVISGFRDKSSR